MTQSFIPHFPFSRALWEETCDQQTPMSSPLLTVPSSPGFVQTWLSLRHCFPYSLSRPCCLLHRVYLKARRWGVRPHLCSCHSLDHSLTSSLKTCGCLQLSRLPVAVSCRALAEAFGYGLGSCSTCAVFWMPIDGLSASLASLFLVFVHLLNYKHSLPGHALDLMAAAPLIPNSPLPDPTRLIKTGSLLTPSLSLHLSFSPSPSYPVQTATPWQQSPSFAQLCSSLPLILT